MVIMAGLRFVGLFIKNFLLLLLLIVVAYFGGVLALTSLWTVINPPVTALMIYRSAHGVAVQPSQFIEFKQIPRFARQSAVYLEDHLFWSHHGLVPGEIVEAWKTNQRTGELTRGASTITQQLARNLFLFPDKLWIRKILEAGTALILETVLSKQRIMELYLNYIEWGPGIFGIERGAQYHFKKSVTHLNREQISRLMCIIINPLKYNVQTYWKNRSMNARYWALIDW